MEDKDMKNKDTVIKCDSVYKIFGPNAEKMLEQNSGHVDPKVFQKKRLYSWCK